MKGRKGDHYSSYPQRTCESVALQPGGLTNAFVFIALIPKLLVAHVSRKSALNNKLGLKNVKLERNADNFGP